MKMSWSSAFQRFSYLIKSFEMNRLLIWRTERRQSCMGQNHVICWWIPGFLLRAHTGCYGRSIKAAEAVSPDVNVGVGCMLVRAEASFALLTGFKPEKSHYHCPSPFTFSTPLFSYETTTLWCTPQPLSQCGVFFFKVNLEAEVSLYESVFVKPVADHMTPCCTVWLGPDLQAFPVSSGVSVTSTITLLLFYSHEPLCQSSQNQADGARWQQKACKSWIIWLEILFNYSTKWPSWIQINTCSPLYNMCKQLLQF